MAAGQREAAVRGMGVESSAVCRTTEPIAAGFSLSGWPGIRGSVAPPRGRMVYVEESCSASLATGLFYPPNTPISSFTSNVAIRPARQKTSGPNSNAYLMSRTVFCRFTALLRLLVHTGFFRLFRQLF